MKRLPKIFILTCGLIILAGSCNKSDTVIITDSMQNSLQLLLDNTLASYKSKYPNYPGGLAMEVITDKGTWFVSAGMGNVTNQVHFRAASNTKTLTSTAILLLYQQGKLDIHKRIIDTIPGTQMPYIPDAPEYDIPYKSSITILQLLHHRAGVFDVTNNNIPDTVSAPVPYKGKNYLEYVISFDSTHTFTFDELVNVNAVCRLYNFVPGASYHYSNTGYSLLGKIIERVSGKSYQQFMIEDVMAPIGMTHSSMPVLGTERTIPSPFATGYEALPSGEILNVTISNMSGNVAEGNLITTPDDLGHFLRKLLSGQGVLNPHTVNAVMMKCLPTSETTTNAYGCGLTYTNNLGYGHNGAHEGYLSQMVYDPGSGFTAMIFTNAWNTVNGMTTIGEQLTLLENTCYLAKEIVRLD